MNKLLSTILFFVVFSGLTIAQSFEEDMAKMEAAYQGVDDLYLEMENSIWQDQKMEKQQNTIIQKKGALYLYKMDEAIMLINTKYILMIDEVSKTIIYDKWTAEKAENLAKQHIPATADILKRYPSVVYQGTAKQHKNYVLENKNIQMSKVEISFEISTGFMRLVRYYYNPELVDKEIYTELKMKKIDTNPSFAASNFSEKRFITQVGNQFKGVGKYSNYAVRSAN
ncbi:hypothetical protein [Aureispira anguillae]|uniref:Outer membrane lipoprotein-sorting protein n=1 Tax=Aureispira anguillae TaxID=2864201 RepID=A0A915YLP3_9BACT|nr:hypothetical protein [Aureispira anguillae]BDS15413.1 hypothetical protein AsAng_0061970 [Aureispira anguillae]